MAVWTPSTLWAARLSAITMSPGLQGRHEDLFDGGEETGPVHRAIEDPGGGEPGHPQRRDEGTALPPALGDVRSRPQRVSVFVGPGPGSWPAGARSWVGHRYAVTGIVVGQVLVRLPAGVAAVAVPGGHVAALSLPWHALAPVRVLFAPLPVLLGSRSVVRRSRVTIPRPLWRPNR